MKLQKTTDFVLATRNPSKHGEFEQLLDRLIGWRLLRELQERFAGIVELPERAPTFTGNAAVKAWHAARQLGVHALADDSGLVVPALKGRPGLYSKRFAPTVPERQQRLLREMQGVPIEQRSAYFVCGVAFATPEGKHLAANGRIDGRITLAPRAGLEDFDYSSVFEVEVAPGVWRTIGELNHLEWILSNHRHAACNSLFGKMGWLQ